MCLLKLCVLMSVGKPDYQMYMPRAHLRKGALRPQYYSYVIIAFCFECRLSLLSVFSLSFLLHDVFVFLPHDVGIRLWFKRTREKRKSTDITVQRM